MYKSQVEMSWNKTKYDTCAFEQYIGDTTYPLEYNLFRGKFVNCNRCHVTQDTYVPLVDVESELQRRMRFNSRCNKFKYDPNCTFTVGGQNMCLSTFDKLAPINLPPQVCPDAERYLYFNSGLRKPTHPGYVLPSSDVCQKAISCRAS